MKEVAEVQFREAGKIYYFDPAGLDLRLREAVVVETERGVDMGYIIRETHPIDESKVVEPLRKILRKATAEDWQRIAEVRKKEQEAFPIALREINRLGLPMKLVAVQSTLDGSKITFYFVAEKRVDFRELVKQLAGIFKTRIELRQIGVRDEAKLLKSYGCCGRPLCCATFLRDFVPVSIRMAKEQNLSLNPEKISGLCGRLMCCLIFEFENYSRKSAAEEGPRETSSIEEAGKEISAEEKVDKEEKEDKKVSREGEGEPSPSEDVSGAK